MTAYQELLNEPPATVPWSDVAEFDRLDDRRACVDALFPNILGVNEGFVEWCPNDDPPSEEETLAWLWFIRPDLSGQIARDTSDDLTDMIRHYKTNALESWWRKSAE